MNIKAKVILASLLLSFLDSHNCLPESYTQRRVRIDSRGRFFNLTNEELAQPTAAKIIRWLHPLPKAQERWELLEEAGWNVAKIPLEKVFLDTFTDLGTSVFTEEQWAALHLGDEAYSGSSSFLKLVQAVNEVFGRVLDETSLVTVGSGLEAVKVISRYFLRANKKLVLGNLASRAMRLHIKENGGVYKELVNARAFDLSDTSVFKGNVDLEKLKQVLSDPELRSQIAFINLNTSSDMSAGQPISLGNIKAVANLAAQYHIPVVLDASRIRENAYLIKKFEAGNNERSLESIIKEIALYAKVLTFSARANLANEGGFIAAQQREFGRRLAEFAATYTGLPSTGGMARRDMEVIATGLKEVLNENFARHHYAQTRYLAKRLHEMGVPIAYPPSGHAVFVDATKFNLREEEFPAETVAALIYLISGVRTAPGVLPYALEENEHKNIPYLNTIRVSVPFGVYTKNQLDYIAATISWLYQNRHLIKHGLAITEPTDFEQFLLQHASFEPLDQFDYQELLQRSEVDNLIEMNILKVEPYSIDTVDVLPKTGVIPRKHLMREVGFNPWWLPSEQIDWYLLTDSGTGAKSRMQWLAMMGAEEGPNNPEAKLLQKAIGDVYGYDVAFFSKEGRGAEFILAQSARGAGRIEGDVILGNMFYPTVRMHQRIAGAEDSIQIVLPSFSDPSSDEVFKGNVDIEGLRNLIKQRIAQFGSPKIAYLSIEVNGSQPISMENLKAVRELTLDYNIPLFIDATRAIEGAYAIKKYEDGYHNKTSAQILKEIVKLSDGATVSSRKDNRVNIGGFLAFMRNKRTEKFIREAQRLAQIHAGFFLDGSMSARNLAAFRVGVYEMTNEEYVKQRFEQVRKLGEILEARGVPIQYPPGGSAIYLNASEFAKHLPKEQFRAWSTLAALFIYTGIAASEIGAIAAGKDTQGNIVFPETEWVRLILPRLVFTDAQIEYLADLITDFWERRTELIKGLTLEYYPQESESLPAFFVRFREAN